MPYAEAMGRPAIPWLNTPRCAPSNQEVPCQILIRVPPLTKLDLPKDAWLGFHGEWFVLKTRSPWTVGGTTYAPDTLLGGPLPTLLSSAPTLEVLFEGGEPTSLQSFFWLRGRLYLSILDNLKPCFEVYTPAPAGWTRAPLAGLPDAHDHLAPAVRHRGRRI
jgi:prolyl oligopeptidase PreP (S9A serine peptidase family)